MPAATAIIAGVAAAAAVAGTTHSVESSNQAKRVAGQKKNEALAIDATNTKKLNDLEASEEATRQRDLARSNQRRRSISMGAGPSAAGTDIIGSGTGSLIGS